MKIDKKKWFDVKDSLTKREDGRGTYYNVEARFSDHPVINVPKSKIARRNVYEFSIVLHTRVKRAALDAKAQPNMASHTMRFDKGEAMGGEDFTRAKDAIMRCWDAWVHYQNYREAPVTTAELMALEQINQAPLSALGTLDVEHEGRMVKARFAGDESDDYEDEDEDEAPVARPVVKPAPKPAKARKPKAA